MKAALARHGKPDILNLEHGRAIGSGGHATPGSQFTSADFIKVLAGGEIKISMADKAAWRDKVFVERLWRTIKYDEVYLHA